MNNTSQECYAPAGIDHRLRVSVTIDVRAAYGHRMFGGRMSRTPVFYPARLRDGGRHYEDPPAFMCDCRHGLYSPTASIILLPSRHDQSIHPLSPSSITRLWLVWRCFFPVLTELEHAAAVTNRAEPVLPACSTWGLSGRPADPSRSGCSPDEAGAEQLTSFASN